MTSWPFAVLFYVVWQETSYVGRRLAVHASKPPLQSATRLSESNRQYMCARVPLEKCPRRRVKRYWPPTHYFWLFSNHVFFLHKNTLLKLGNYFLPRKKKKKKSRVESTKFSKMPCASPGTDAERCVWGRKTKTMRTCRC